jgi:putative flippase GtrA
MRAQGQLRKWLTAPVDNLFGQLPRALVVSVLALLVDVALYETLIRLAGMPAVPAAVVGYLSGGMIQYVLCTVWVFSTAPGNHATGFVVFVLLSLVGLGITCAVIYVLNDLGHANELLAKIAAIGLAFTWNFLSRKFFLFKLTPEEAAS